MAEHKLQAEALERAESQAAPSAAPTTSEDAQASAKAVNKRLARLAKPQDYTLSVLIPVYNERETLLEILERVRDVEIKKEIVLVDDGSQDGTRDLMRDLIEGKYPDVKVVYHEKNQGKGAAIRTAIQHATGDYMIIQDADLEYDPREYYALLEPILDGRADVVFGSRFLGGGAHRVHFFWHRMGNGLLTLLSNMLTNLNLTDMEVCYKVFKAEVLKNINLKSNRFDFEPEITAKVAKKRYRIYEVPISYSGRDYDEGKKIGWRDGVQAIWTIFKYRFFD
ncbi:MAG TPA: glycosyltransferase family 2 protein [Chthonomonadaceae bacterium]|nr:glycosyltransferase family 2 protein [Chthonomonadaceae bacterium]